jgi:hypothetical protein
MQEAFEYPAKREKLFILHPVADAKTHEVITHAIITCYYRHNVA